MVTKQTSRLDIPDGGLFYNRGVGVKSKYEETPCKVQGMTFKIGAHKLVYRHIGQDNWIRSDAVTKRQIAYAIDNADKLL